MAVIAAGEFRAEPTRLWKATLWILQIAGAAMFLMAGTSKLTGAAGMVQVFAAVGLGQWLRYFTGVLEVAGAAALLVPAFAGLGALWLTGVNPVVLGPKLVPPAERYVPHDPGSVPPKNSCEVSPLWSA